MNNFDAIMSAADQIETHPTCYGFAEISTPRNINGRGCALGWIGFFGRSPIVKFFTWSYWIGCKPAGTKNDFVFYQRMNSIDPKWRTNAKNCAAALRTYATRFANNN